MPQRRTIAPLCLLLITMQSIGCSQVFRIHDNVQALRQVKRHVLDQQEPETPEDPAVDLLAKEMDWLEHQIDTYGSIVPKQPDVWGESRLTKYRQDIERELSKELTQFTSTLQGSVQRSDSSALAVAATLSSVASGQTPPTTSANSLLVSNGTPLVPQSSPPAPPTPPSLSEFDTGQATAAGSSNQISLEPEVYVDQLSRYLHHLNDLRRINNGDDTSDAPGYTLNLVRIPISVLPGKRTQRGYGAELTVTAEPHLGEDLLPTTFRDLVINDLVQELMLPVTRAVNDPRIAEIYQKVSHSEHQLPPGDKISPAFIKAFETAVLPLSLEMSHVTSATQNRRSRSAFPPLHVTQNYGLFGLGNVALDAWAGLHALPPNKAPHPNEVIHLTFVQSFLQGELGAAYDLLSRPGNARLWETYCTAELVDVVRNRQVEMLRSIRQQFYNEEPFNKEYIDGTRTTATLAWAILVESAMLNDRLAHDMRELATKKDCFFDAHTDLPFFGPNPPLESRAAFMQYVQCRWPVKVFALDPVEQDQDLAEVYSRRSELQLAMAISVARGTMSAGAASRFARTLETDMQYIDLNQTAVGFSHGNDTFGWRFMPRIQSPPRPTTLEAISQSLGGGPTEDQDIRDRKLAPGIRECTAVIVMPSFVQYVDFHTRANWYGLTNPAKKEWTVHETMRLSKSHRAIEEHWQQACSSPLYRDGDVRRLGEVIDQLGQRMPLQSMPVRVPLDNKVGGFELFDADVTDLGPKLHGWYGSPGIELAQCSGCDVCTATASTTVSATVPNGLSSGGTVGSTAGATSPSQPATSGDCMCKGSTLFLVGRKFSVHDTEVIAGGKCVLNVSLVSRGILKVNIPAGAYPVTYCDALDGEVRQTIDIHVATPYGVTNHLLIPVYKPRDVPCGKHGSPTPAKNTAGVTQTETVPPGTIQSGTVTPGTVTPGTVTPGTGTPGTGTPGTVTPGTVTPGTVTPGTVTPGTVTPGTVTPGTVTPGTVTPGTVTPGTVTPGTGTPGTGTPGTGTPGTGTPGTGTPGTDTSGTDTPGSTTPAGHSDGLTKPLPPAPLPLPLPRPLPMRMGMRRVPAVDRTVRIAATRRSEESAPGVRQAGAVSGQLQRKERSQDDKTPFLSRFVEE